MGKVQVRNTTRETLPVAVRHADGKLDNVQIAPQGRVDLREGMTVDKRYAALNKNKLVIIAPEVPKVETAKPVAPNAFKAPLIKDSKSGDE